MNARSGLWWLTGCLVLAAGLTVGAARAEGADASPAPAIARLQAASVEHGEEGIALSLEANADLNYKVFRLENPARVVVDLFGVGAPLAAQAPSAVPGLRAVRYSLWKPSATEPIVRYVVETSAPATYRVDDGGRAITVWVALPEACPAVQPPADETILRGEAAGSAPSPTGAPTSVSAASQIEPAATPRGDAPPLEAPARADATPAEPGLAPIMVPLGVETDWAPSPRLEPTNLGELIQLGAMAPVSSRAFAALPTGGGEAGCMEVWGGALVLGAPQPASQPAPESAVEPTTAAVEPTTAAVEPTTAFAPAASGEPSPATAEPAAPPTAADLPAEGAANATFEWPTVTFLPSELAARDEVATPPVDRVATAADPTDVGVTVETTVAEPDPPTQPERVAFAEPAGPTAPVAVGTTETVPVGTTEPDQDAPVAGRLRDRFQSLIDQYRPAAATRAHRDWTQDFVPHDSAPLLGDADADFPLATGGSRQPAPMSLDVQGADIHTVLRSIAEFAGVNIVADKDVAGRISLRAVDLPWPDMLRTVCRAMGLVAIDHGMVIRVATERVAQDEAVARESAARKQEEYMPLATRIVTLRYAQAGELKDLIATMRGNRGQVEVDPRTNALILTDIEPRLDLLEQTLRTLDSQTMQVEITAEIVDVDFTEARKLGITWGVDNLHSVSANASGSFEVASPNVLDPGATADIGVLRSFGEVHARIEALANENKADIISTPRITTVNNREARILVGKEVPLITMDEAGNAITELKKVGITLQVTPYVNSEDQITLDLHPEVSDLSSQSTVQGGVVFTTTQADARVMVREGETAVIGGLIRTLEGKLEQGVPLLKDVPVLGQFFKYSDQRQEKRELLIFVTPRLVRAAEVQQR